MESFDRRTFFATIRDSLFDKTLSQRQVDGLTAILDAWNACGHDDKRWLAYCLATAKHETGSAMWPVREGGLGKGHPYGRSGAHDGQIAYGRGFVQLTWDENYARADERLELHGALLADFDVAMNPATAARILIAGMIDGWFTAFKLGDYLNDHSADYLHARRVVNGMDCAQTIAAYALVFFMAIELANHRGADHSAVVSQKPASPSPMNLFGFPAPRAPAVVSALPIAPAPLPAPVARPAPTPVATPQPASQPQGNPPMNAASVVAILSAVQMYAPKVIAIMEKFPDLVANAQRAIAAVKAGDYGSAELDFEKILGDFGIGQAALAASVTAAVRMSPADAPR